MSYDIPPPDASDSWDGYTGWEQSVVQSPQNYVTDQLASGCHIDRPGNGAHATYTYKTFIPIEHEDERDLKLDEYSPLTPLTPLTSEYPVLVLVHGGGWVAGCRGVVSREAKLFAGRLLLQDEDVVEEKFIVFSIDHRLACDMGSYLDAPDSPLPYLCGWRWDTEDDNEGDQAQAGVRDLGDVIRWIKDTTGGWEDQPGSLYEYWDEENIMVVGASSGGNLVASFAGRAAADPDIRPTAVALLSGFPETGQASTQDWSCDAGSSMAETCWQNLNNYLNCGVVNGQAPDEAVEACQEEDAGGEIRYEDASPINEDWDYPNTPAMFIASGGYGSGNYDLSPLQLSLDFHQTLDTQGNYEDETNLKLCQVASGGHATSYLDKEIRNCEGDDEDDEVIESLVAFFVEQMT